MQSMDNQKLLETISKYAVHQYLEKLVNTSMHKITLFTAFPQTGAANISDGVQLLLIDNISALTNLACGADNN